MRNSRGGCVVTPKRDFWYKVKDIHKMFLTGITYSQIDFYGWSCINTNYSDSA